MRTPTPLPPELGPTGFSVDEARALGVTADRLQAQDLWTPSRGLRLAAPATSVSDACALMAQALEEPFAFSHATAARLHGLPLPTRWSIGEMLHVVRHTRANAPRRRGVRGHRGLEVRTTVMLHGQRVVGIEDTWCDLAESLALIHLVALGDAAVNRTHVSVLTLTETVQRRGGFRGVVAARMALPLIRVGTRSAMESQARFIVVDAGIPEPEVNASIVSADGEWLAEADLAWRRQRVIGEVDGDQHRARRQWQADVRLRRRLVDEGWRIEAITGDDLLQPALAAQLVIRMKRVLGA